MPLGIVVLPWLKYLVHLVDWPWPLDKGVATGLIGGFDRDGLLRLVAWLCLVMVVSTTPIGLRWRSTLGVVGNMVRVGGGELALVFENEGAVGSWRR